MSTRTITLELNEHDYDAVQTAIAIRQRSRIWPDQVEGDPAWGVGHPMGECDICGAEMTWYRDDDDLVTICDACRLDQCEEIAPELVTCQTCGERFDHCLCSI